MNIALLGYGTVGQGVDELLKNDPGLHVTRILSRTYRPGMGNRAVSSISEILSDPEIGTVVELIGGTDPAFSYVNAALLSGRNVVTANKALVAAFYPELRSAAEKTGAKLFFTAAAGGGIPWLSNLGAQASSERITELGGVMNGTSNYILDEMTERGKAFGEVLKTAQELGYAEADPSADIDGPDTRRKLVLSALIGFHVLFREDDIPTFGIRHISTEDVRAAGDADSVIRLTAFARLLPDGETEAAVIPAFVRRTSAEAALHGPENRFYLSGEKLGPQGFTGRGAGRYPTALNVVRDLKNLAAGGAFPLPEPVSDRTPALDQSHRFYLRTGDRVSFETLTLADLLSKKTRAESNGTPFFAALL